MKYNSIVSPTKSRDCVTSSAVGLPLKREILKLRLRDLPSLLCDSPGTGEDYTGPSSSPSKMAFPWLQQIGCKQTEDLLKVKGMHDLDHASAANIYTASIKMKSTKPSYVYNTYAIAAELAKDGAMHADTCRIHFCKQKSRPFSEYYLSNQAFPKPP